MNAKEFLLHPDNADKTLPEILEAYHKSKVDAISDEEIEYQAEIESGFVSGLEGTYEEGKLIGFENGAEFIKSKLKE